MITIENNIVGSTEADVWIRSKATGTCFRPGKGSALAGDTPESYEELTAAEYAAIEQQRAQQQDGEAYAARVSELIRGRYSVDAELAILRQRDTKPAEFAAYNAFAEQCKARARQEIVSSTPTTGSLP